MVRWLIFPSDFLAGGGGDIMSKTILIQKNAPKIN